MITPDDQLRVMSEALGRHQPVEVTDPARGRAAVALVHVPSPTGPELLVIKRADREGDPWSGQMALPGGRYQSEDPTLLDTAIRETREETGVILKPSQVLGALSDLAPTTPILPPVAVRPFVFGLPRKPTVTLNHEATMHLWVSLETLRSSTGPAQMEIGGRDRKVEAFHVHGEVIWGMTQRIIMPFLNLVNAENGA